MVSGEEALTPDAAKQQIAQTMLEASADPAHPYLNASNPLSDHVRADMKRWHEIAYPEPGGGEASSSAPGGESAPLPALPEGVVWNEPGVAEFRSGARELEIPDADAEEWITYYAQTFAEEFPDSATTERQLREEWGGQSERKLAAARLFASRLPAVVRSELEYGLGDDPRVIRYCAARGAPMLEAWEKLQGVYQDPKHPYHARFAGTLEHEKAVAQVRQLFERIYGTGGGT